MSRGPGGDRVFELGAGARPDGGPAHRPVAKSDRGGADAGHGGLLARRRPAHGPGGCHSRLPPDDDDGMEKPRQRSSRPAGCSRTTTQDRGTSPSIHPATRVIFTLEVGPDGRRDRPPDRRRRAAEDAWPRSLRRRPEYRQMARQMAESGTGEEERPSGSLTVTPGRSASRWDPSAPAPALSCSPRERRC